MLKTKKTAVARVWVAAVLLGYKNIARFCTFAAKFLLHEKTTHRYF
jgi:hypothetical protein